MAKTLVLVLLLTVICSATYIAVSAAEDPTALRGTTNYDYDYGVPLPKGGETGKSDIENAPALRLDSNVVIPLETTEEIDKEEVETEDVEEDYIAPPATGAVSDSLQLFGAVALLGTSLLVVRRRKSTAA